MARSWLPTGGVLGVVLLLLAYILTGVPAVAGESSPPGGAGTRAVATPTTPTPGGAADYVPAEVVVKLRAATDLPGVAAAYGLDPNPLDQFGARPIFRLRIADGSLPPAKAEALLADGQSRVIYAEPNYLGQTPEGQQRYSWSDGGNAGGYATQWAPGRIRLPEAHQITRGAGVTVAILDTGVDVSHPALAGRTVPGYDFVDQDDDPSEVGNHAQHVVYGHGTHVAGLVALAAPEARIMPVRVLDRDGVGNIWVLAEALAYAVDPDGDPATDDGADVINLSLGTPRPTRLLAEIVADVICADDDDDDDCLARAQGGAVVAAAAGNGGGTTPEYPAAEGLDGLLAVAASTEADGLAPFSTRGPWVQVAAPGDRIISSVPGGGYGVWSGTSMAAPLVAGQAALIRAFEPARRAIEISARIVETAAPIAGPVPRRIDAAASLGLAPQAFGDVPAGSPAYEAIRQLSARGIIRGYGDGRFGPDDPTLRAQMAALITRAMGWDGESHGTAFPDQCDPPGPYDPGRNCVDPDLWRNVGTLEARGVAKGYQDGTYGPRNDVLAAQAISFIARGMVARGFWQPQPDDAALYPNVTDPDHRRDIATYVFYAGALPETGGTGEDWGAWDGPGTRGWFARALWQALVSYYGSPDRVP